MKETLEIVSKILPIILLILLGAVFQRTRYITTEAVRDIKKIVVNIALPLVIFTSLINVDFSAQYLWLALIVFVVTTALLLVGQLIKRLSGSPNRYLPALFTSYENGMIGYGVLAVVFGQQNIYPIVVLDLGQTLFFSLIFVAYMQITNGKAVASPSKLLLSFLKNPYVWASVLAIGLKSIGAVEVIRAVPPLNAVLESFGLIAALTTPLMCMIIGYETKIDLRNLKKPLGVVCLRMAIMMAVATLLNVFVINRLFHLESLFTTAVYTMFMLPPFFVGALLIQDEAQEEKHFALNVISLNILVFLILFTGMIVLFPR